MDMSFPEEYAAGLLWVLQGAGRGEHDGMIVFSPIGGAKVEVSANTAIPRRRMIVASSGEDEFPAACPAKALIPLCKSVDEGKSLSISVDDESVRAACGATSMKVANDYDLTALVTHKRQFDSVVDGIDAADLCAAVSHVSKVGASEMIADVDAHGNMVLSAGDGGLVARETVVCSPVDDGAKLFFAASTLKALKAWSKIGDGVSLSIAVAGESCVRFSAAVESYESPAPAELIFDSAQTLTRDAIPDPDDAPEVPTIVVDKARIISALTVAAAATGSRGVLTVSNKENARTNLVVSSVLGNDTAKSVLVDCVATNTLAVSCSPADISHAMSVIPEKEVGMSVVGEGDDVWLVLSCVAMPTDDDSEGVPSDIAVYVSCENVK